MLKSSALNDIARFIDEQIVKADYTINGVTYPANIRRSFLRDNKVIKHVYLTTKDPVGTVTRVRLIDKNGNIFAENNINKAHEKNKGRLFEFQFIVQEV